MLEEFPSTSVKFTSSQVLEQDSMHALESCMPFIIVGSQPLKYSGILSMACSCSIKYVGYSKIDTSVIYNSAENAATLYNIYVYSMACSYITAIVLTTEWLQTSCGYEKFILVLDASNLSPNHTLQLTTLRTSVRESVYILI